MRTFPCPHCARNIIYAGIKEVVYELDYGDDYGYNLFDKAGVKYRRFDE
jgi:deoxycytidylate deaminase